MPKEKKLEATETTEIWSKKIVRWERKDKFGRLQTGTI
jgi:hypothetical protein